MLRWAANLFILIAITGMFGFGRMASFLAKLLFVLLSVLSFVAVVSQLAGRGVALLLPRRPVEAPQPRALAARA
jgi:hypothetical protein